MCYTITTAKGLTFQMSTPFVVFAPIIFYIPPFLPKPFRTKARDGFAHGACTQFAKNCAAVVLSWIAGGGERWSFIWICCSQRTLLWILPR